MSILHTVNKSAYERNALDSFLGHTKPGDSVLLIEDGVISARAGSVAGDKLAAALGETGVSIYALGADMAARGIPEDKLVDGVKVVDYAGFVDLAAENDAVEAWL